MTDIVSHYTYRERRMALLQNQQKNKPAVVMALVAALLYGISAPVSKILLNHIPPTLMAGLLYFGAGLGMSALHIIQNGFGKIQNEARLQKKDLPYVLGMVVLDIVAPILLLMGLGLTTSGNVSLLNNFEIVVTSLIALAVFKEAIGKRMWLSIGLVTAGTFLLSIEDFSQFTLSIGAMFVLGATVCWGFENNCTRMLSLSNPLHIVIIKGFGSGMGSLSIAYFLGETSRAWTAMALALLLGFVAYGLSIFFYIYAQRDLGAARTSAFYAAAPFIGVLTSWIFLKEPLHLSFVLALIFMLAGTYFGLTESHGHYHKHLEMQHDHKHRHDDMHHDHYHEDFIEGEHSHPHRHTEVYHTHEHTPDMHHHHSHSE